MPIFTKLQDLLKQEDLAAPAPKTGGTPPPPAPHHRPVVKKAPTHHMPPPPPQRKIEEEVEQAEMMLLQAKADIDRRMGALEERERILATKESQIDQRVKEIEEIKDRQLEKLEKVSTLTRDEANKQIMALWEDKMRQEVAKRIREAEQVAKQESDRRAKELLVEAMNHGATDYVAEYTVSGVKVADEEMKGRIIGKEGRNIRAFEQATGVDVDLDEEGVIRLSCFDSVRREIARVALEKLLRDTRIHPARIEEVVNQTRKEIERIMFEEGQKLLHASGIFNLHPDLIAYVGRFKYRFSYGQNMLAHSLEQVKIAVKIANEVGANPNIVRLGSLLSDIGKVITDKEGSHVVLGVELLKKYNMPKEVIDCVAQHHEDEPFTSIESVIVHIADAISGVRPGARYEDIEGYTKRLSDLEAIAQSHEGVRQAYAISAGREVRVIVDPERLDDAQCTILASKIKDEVEKKLTYPGEVRVTVIREYRAVDTAK